MASLTLKNIKKVYPFNGDDAKQAKKKKKGDEPEKKKSNLQITEEGVVAVQEFNLDIADKEFIVLVGPSGCGKSTTLRMVAGLEEISGGELYIGDRLVNDVAPKDRDIAMVFQNYALYGHMTVYENMAFSLKLRKVDKATIDAKVKEGNTAITIIDKPTFGSRDLGEMLLKLDAEEKIASITFIGVCTDICVISNALMLKAFLPEMPVSVDSACCAGVTPETHQAALTTMQCCQIDIQ